MKTDTVAKLATFALITFVTLAQPLKPMSEVPLMNQFNLVTVEASTKKPTPTPKPSKTSFWTPVWNNEKKEFVDTLTDMGIIPRIGIHYPGQDSDYINFGKQSPFIENNTFYIPAYTLLTKLGFIYKYDAKTKTTSLKYGSMEVSYTLDKKVIKVNGIEYKFNRVTNIMKNDKVFVSVDMLPKIGVFRSTFKILISRTLV